MIVFSQITTLVWLKVDKSVTRSIHIIDALACLCCKHRKFPFLHLTYWSPEKDVLQTSTMPDKMIQKSPVLRANENCNCGENAKLPLPCATDNQISSMNPNCVPSDGAMILSVNNSESSAESFFLLRASYLLITLVIMLADGLQGRVNLSLRTPFSGLRYIQ